MSKTINQLLSEVPILGTLSVPEFMQAAAAFGDVNGYAPPIEHQRPARAGATPSDAKPKAPKKRGSSKASEEVIGQVLAALQKAGSDGLKKSGKEGETTLATACDASPDELGAAIKELKADGRIRGEGKGRGTRWVLGSGSKQEEKQEEEEGEDPLAVAIYNWLADQEEPQAIGAIYDALNEDGIEGSKATMRSRIVSMVEAGEMKAHGKSPRLSYSVA